MRPKCKNTGEINAKELIGKWVKGPIVNYELYILPAAFIDTVLVPLGLLCA